ncbi:hypothetical protein ACTL6U_14410 [Rhodovibrionaceae bacterium A322]
MSDQVVEVQSKVTAGEIIQDSWAWMVENKRTIGLILTIIIGLPALIGLILFSTDIPKYNLALSQGTGFFVFLLAFLGIAFAYLFAAGWFVQRVLGLRAVEAKDYRAQVWVLKLFIRYFLLGVIAAAVYFPLIWIAIRVLPSAMGPQVFFSVLSSPIFVVALWLVSTFAYLAYTAYTMIYLVGGLVRHSDELTDSIKISHRNFKALFLIVVFAAALPIGIELLSGVLVSVASTPANPAPGPLAIILSILGVVATLLCWLLGHVLAAIAYKKIVGLPELSGGTDAESTSPA